MSVTRDPCGGSDRRRNAQLGRCNLAAGKVAYSAAGLKRMNDSKLAQFQTLSLERLRYWVGRMISPKMLDDVVSMESYVDIITKSVMLRFQAQVFCQQLDAQFVRYPADWWEAVRERFAPRWWLKRWPVVYIEKRMRL